jgi:hypothetical protein
VRAIGVVFAEFGKQTQDSGNYSYGVRIGAERFFVKTAGQPADPQPTLRHAARVALLHNAVRLHASCRHPILPPLLSVIESPTGPLLVYPWADGELLGVPRDQRENPQSSFQRFRGLPAPKICDCLDAIYDLHVALARAGWIAVDFYDGCLIYDFAAERIAVVDLDMYRAGPFQNERGRPCNSCLARQATSPRRCSRWAEPRCCTYLTAPSRRRRFVARPRSLRSSREHATPIAHNGSIRSRPSSKLGDQREPANPTHSISPHNSSWNRSLE